MISISNIFVKKRKMEHEYCNDVDALVNVNDEQIKDINAKLSNISIGSNATAFETLCVDIQNVFNKETSREQYNAVVIGGRGSRGGFIKRGALTVGRHIKSGVMNMVLRLRHFVPRNKIAQMSSIIESGDRHKTQSYMQSLFKRVDSSFTLKTVLQRFHQFFTPIVKGKCDRYALKIAATLSPPGSKGRTMKGGRRYFATTFKLTGYFALIVISMFMSYRYAVFKHETIANANADAATFVKKDFSKFVRDMMTVYYNDDNTILQLTRVVFINVVSVEYRNLKIIPVILSIACALWKSKVEVSSEAESSGDMYADIASTATSELEPESTSTDQPESTSTDQPEFTSTDQPESTSTDQPSSPAATSKSEELDADRIAVDPLSMHVEDQALSAIQNPEVTSSPDRAKMFSDIIISKFNDERLIADNKLTLLYLEGAIRQYEKELKTSERKIKDFFLFFNKYFAINEYSLKPVTAKQLNAFILKNVEDSDTIYTPSKPVVAEDESVADDVRGDIVFERSFQNMTESELLEHMKTITQSLDRITFFVVNHNHDTDKVVVNKYDNPKKSPLYRLDQQRLNLIVRIRLIKERIKELRKKPKKELKEEHNRTEEEPKPEKKIASHPPPTRVIFNVPTSPDVPVEVFLPPGFRDKGSIGNLFEKPDSSSLPDY